MSDLQTLPTGEQDFVDLRIRNNVYVDKTKYIVKMIKEGKYYFLSRPRRFGKSLTVSTIDALFSGRKALFSGLAIEKYLDHELFHPGPVLRIDISSVKTNFDKKVTFNSICDDINVGLTDILTNNARRHGIELRGERPGLVFGNLIQDLCEKSGRVIILVDEYDYLLLQSVSKNLYFEETKNELRNFFIEIKNKSAFIRFVFLTGVSRFSKLGIFSVLNNLTDITIDQGYGAMLGYTQEELEDKFKQHINDTAKLLTNGDEGKLLEMIKDYYDGFCFDGATCVYNPYSLLRFFLAKKFSNYWFATATPTALAEFMKKRKVIVEQFSNIPISLNSAMEPGELKESATVNFLYQTGYLTLKPGNSPDSFKLDYPNYEVRTSMSSLMMWNFFGDQFKSDAETGTLRDALDNNDIETIIDKFNKILSKIPYDDYAKANRKDIRDRYPRMSFGEFVYRSVLLAFLEGAGVHVLPEIHSSLGRVDLVVERAGHAWVIEIKVAKKAEDVERQADEAMLQIHEKGYARQYDNPVLLGLAIDDRKRCIGGYRLNNEPFRAVEPPPYTVDCARPGLGNLWRMLRRLIGE